MIIKFKLDELDEIMEKYSLLFEYNDTAWVNVDEKRSLNIDACRIVVSKYDISFRLGELFYRNDEVENINDEDAWNFTSPVNILYDTKNKNIEEYKVYSGESLYTLAKMYCDLTSCTEDIFNRLECYIDTDEFIDAQIVEKLYPKNWKKEARKKYSDFFEIIKGQKYSITRDYNFIEIRVSKERVPFFTLSLGDNYIVFRYDSWYCVGNNNEKMYNKTYNKVLDIIKKIVNCEIAVVFIFYSDKKPEINMFVPVNEVQAINDDKSIIKFLKEKNVDLTVDGLHDCISVCVSLWDDDERDFRLWPNNPHCKNDFM